jgi:hypothetical protein
MWEDAREVARRAYLAWGWSPMDAAWTAYYGKPFRAVVITAGPASCGH